MGRKNVIILTIILTILIMSLGLMGYDLINVSLNERYQEYYNQGVFDIIGVQTQTGNIYYIDNNNQLASLDINKVCENIGVIE